MIPDSVQKEIEKASVDVKSMGFMQAFQEGAKFGYELAQKELEECRAKLAIATEALEFYSEEENQEFGCFEAKDALSKINGEIKEGENK